MTYQCLYCEIEHADATATEEHIVPRALLNRNYVLTPVCNRWNQFMAHSFETPMLGSTWFRELLLVFDKPPAGKKFIDTVLDDHGGTYDRYFDNGRQVLKKRPSKTTVDTFTIKVRARSGTVLDFELRLPFSIHRSVSGAFDLVRRDRLKARVEEERDLVLEHVRTLVTDPSVRPPDLVQFLKEQDAEMLIPPGARIDEEWLAGPPTLVDNLANASFRVDTEQSRKFFMKIAWTHACKQLGRAAVSGPIASFILDYIRKGAVERDLVCQAPHLFSDAKTVDASSHYFWRDPPQESLVKAQTLAAPTLEAPARERVTDFHTAGNFVRFELPVTLKFDPSLTYPHLRFHELALEPGSIRGVDGTCCQVSLFGGTSRVTVLLDRDTSRRAFPPATRIDF